MTMNAKMPDYDDILRVHNRADVHFFCISLG